MEPLFITGGSGFVGRHVLGRLREEARADVTCLTRRPAELALLVPPLPGWRYVRGDVRQPAEWASFVEPGAVVLHLAAATGKAAAEAHRSTNVDGTRALVATCLERRASRMVFVSSIAAKFTNVAGYAYADSKRVAEEVVRSSGCPFVIVRPTVVFGSGSPAFAGLLRLAGGRLGVLPGDGRVPVQPVDVRDLAAALLELADDPSPPLGATLEIGGPERVSMGELLQRIRLAARGRRGRFVRLPLGPLRAFVSALGRVLGESMPLGAGQLASFANDGTAAAHRWLDRRVGSFRGIEEMLTGGTRP